MANFTENNAWEPVRRFEHTDDASADVFNAAIQQVVNREAHLKQFANEVEAARGEEASLDARLAYIEQLAADGGSGGGYEYQFYASYADLPQPGVADIRCVALDTGYTYVWDTDHYTSSFASVNSFPVEGIEGVVYIARDSGLHYTWTGTAYAITFPTFGDFPMTGVGGVEYYAEDEQCLYTWEDDRYGAHYETLSAFPATGREGIYYVADDTNLKWEWTGDGYAAVLGGTPGEGDNTTINEVSLLDALGVSTVAEAVQELHNRTPETGTPNWGGLSLAMYLDIPVLNDGQDTLTHESEYQNLRIRIAGFNTYKNATNTKNHIVFEFKNIPVNVSGKTRMRTNDTNDGGYPKSTETVELKPYLEGGFLDGLKVALGHDYIYPVTRNVTQGQNGAWTKTAFTAAIFPLCEKEVFGTNTNGDATTEADLAQLPIYAQGASKVKNFNGSASIWWEGSPYSSNTNNFCSVNSSGAAYISAAGNVRGVAPAFCLS